MKIYVITKGCYSDYHICAVATDKEKAELLADKFSDRYDSAEIEEYDTDFSEVLLKFKNLYTCWFYEKTKNINIRERDLDCFEMDDLKVRRFSDGLYVKVNAENEQMALKKASDLFSKYRAEQQGL